MKNIPEWSSLKDYASYGADGQEPDISLLEYALSKLTPDLLVAVTRLFYPEFVTHQGSVFLADRFTVPVYDSWKRGRYKNDPAAIERIMNHVHLAESLRHAFFDLSKHNLYFVGGTMVQTWKAALSHEFPGRTFEVQGTPDERGFSADSGDFIITFWENRVT